MTEIEYWANRYKLFDDCIQANRDNRQRVNVRARDVMAAAEYVCENGTVRISLGRGTGKTFWALTRATENDLILFANRANMHTVLRCFGRLPMCSVLHTGDTIPPGRRFDTIYINEPSWYFSRVQMDEQAFYSKFIKDHDQTVVMLG